MPIILNDFEKMTQNAVRHYWETLNSQSKKQKSGKVQDYGRRSAVTGGKQLDGFTTLIKEILVQNGLPESSIHLNKSLELPGYFRPTKEWDMLVIHEGNFLAAMEFKSQRGPSFGNNFNNRSEEAIGTAKDIWTAYREGAFGADSEKPWIGWLMLLEDCPRSNSPVKIAQPHYKVFDEFVDSSYTDRYGILLRKLVREQLYSSAVLLTATEEGGMNGNYKEPFADLTMKHYLAGLAAHISAYLATKK